MSEQPQRPASDEDREGWKKYWEASQPKEWFEAWKYWRTEPEIDEARQRYLVERRAVQADFVKGIYPFRDQNGGIRLTRADVEWLLATHESGDFTGPIDWRDKRQRTRDGLDLRGADLRGAMLQELPLVRLRGGLSIVERGDTPLRMRDTAVARFDDADISATNLEHANLSGVHFEHAILSNANLAGADLFHAHFEGATLTGANVGGANLRFAFFGDTATYLGRLTLTAHDVGPVLLRGVRWGDADLSLIDWSQLRELGDERLARQRLDSKGTTKTRAARVDDFRAAVQAYRKLAVVLHNQGLNEDADKFFFRAQLCQRTVLRLQYQFLRYMGSLLLNIVAGYGYRPLRSFATYLLVVFGFAAYYFVLRDSVHPSLNLLDSIVFSITSFHGRGFAPGESVTLHSPLTIFAAIEAIIGLLIEITLIATFTQRFFAR